MRMSKLFSQTTREEPAEAEIPSHKLLIRAGYIRQLAAGIFSYLPLAFKTLNKIENIMREEINNIGGQEIYMPIVHPADIWKESGRWYKIGSEMGRFRDKNERDMVLSMTHEEVVAEIARKEIRSYRQLPQLVYQIQTKWRDDPRPRAGLIRAREFTMLDSYSLDRDFEGLNTQYQAHYQAYLNIFQRCGLKVMTVQSDVGMMGGKTAHEFMYLTPIGEDTIMICDDCGYAANQQVAEFKKNASPNEPEKSTDDVATPGIKTIEDLSKFLKIPSEKTAKAVILSATRMVDPDPYEELIFAVVRGDMSLNQMKLANALNVDELRPATDEEIRQIGAVPGYASPIGLENVSIIVDDLIPRSANLVAGANKEGYHTINVNYGRDFEASMIADIVTAEEGHSCPKCPGSLRSINGVEVGNIFKLGTSYSESMNCYYTAEDGIIQPIVMGSYGIGSGRLLACIAEEYHDENGLVWPITVAPYQVHLISLAGTSKKPEDTDNDSYKSNTLNIADLFYADLIESSIEVLYDDRDASPGIKFADSDLIGIPIRITISKRSLSQGGIELKIRYSEEKSILGLKTAVPQIQSLIEALKTDFNND